MAHKEASQEFGSQNITLKERYLVRESEEYRLLRAKDIHSISSQG